MNAHPSKGSLNKRLIYLVTTDAYFVSHRLALAERAKKAGFEVFVACRETIHRRTIESKGISMIPLHLLSRAGTNPFHDLRAILEILNLYKVYSPQVVHHVAMKPVLYGSIAALVMRVPKVINALTGLGYLFISEKLWVKTLRFFVLCLMKILFRRRQNILIVQNHDDYDKFRSFLASERLALIRGSGVDTEEFSPSLAQSHNDPLRVALVGRMLWDKGVGIAIDAMKILREQKIALTLLLVGQPDPENPRSIDEETLKKWHSEGLCEWIGHRSDIAKLYQGVDVALLPSFREGLPKSLLEAASCGLPIIASDVPGCREVVEQGKNGFLVPLDARELSEVLAKMVRISPKERHAMGEYSRRLAMEEFSTDRIAKETLKLYG